MNIDKLTLGEIKEISKLINGGKTVATEETNIKSYNSVDNLLIGKYHIFRTYSAGVFFGKLIAKEGDDCVIDECRRLYTWRTKGGISISEIALTGLHSDSKVCAPTNGHCITKIEIITCTEEAIKDIKEKPNHVA